MTTSTWVILLLCCALPCRTLAHLPLVQRPQSMVSAECQTLLQQCGDELGLLGGAGISSTSTTTTTTMSPASVTLEPVCGSDGRTYSSRCELQRARCEGHPVRVRYHGSCHGEEKRCWSERRLAQKTARRHNETSARSVGETFIPECTDDGRFAEVQCHQGTGYCWCVTPDGKPIPGSSIRHKKPNCKIQSKSVPSRRSPSLSKKRRGCASSDKAAFNGHILRLFTTEYNRIPQSASSGSSRGRGSDSVVSDSPEKRVIDWKFAQLDKNNDGFLNRREFRVLRRLVRKLVRPRRCSKNFPRVCDSDRDRRITRAEWSTCLGIGINKDSGEDRDSPGYPTTMAIKPDLDSLLWAKHAVPLQEASSAEDNEQVEANDCYSDRQAALEEVKHGAQGMYVPECTPDNKYQRVQCHKSAGYCWCAQDETGKPIPGTSVQNGKPNCDNLPAQTTLKTTAAPPPKEEKARYQPLSAEAACPGKRKQKLQSDIAELFKENMAAVLLNKTGNNLIPGPDYSLPPRERVARWQLKQLDKNSNNVIDRHEMRDLRLLLKRSPKIRRCSKRIPAFCDINADKRITVEEWLLCLGATKDVSNFASPLASLGGNGKRRGPNPLSTYLKDR